MARNPACSTRISNPSTASDRKKDQRHENPRQRHPLQARRINLGVDRNLCHGCFSVALTDFDDSAHSMMAHATEFETEDGVRAWLIERDPETVHVARHRLGLRDQTTIRRA